MAATNIDFERLFKLRLAVARHGEMDCARWWNTQSVLGRRGGVVLKRGFPRTHRFAQARIVFEVAKSRCHELFDPPGCMTLWNLPADIEEQFQEHWQDWIDSTERWESAFAAVEEASTDLFGTLGKLEVLTEAQAEAAKKLRRSAENRAVPISGSHSPNDDIITLLAAGFSKSEPGAPAIPYARLEE